MQDASLEITSHEKFGLHPRLVHCSDFAMSTHFMLGLSSLSKNSFAWKRKQQTFSEMGHTVNIFCSAGHIVSVRATQLCHLT